MIFYMGKKTLKKTHWAGLGRGKVIKKFKKTEQDIKVSVQKSILFLDSSNN